MKRLVDGKLVDLTEAEIAERQAEEEAWAEQHAAELAQRDLEAKRAAALRALDDARLAAAAEDPAAHAAVKAYADIAGKSA